MRYWTAPDHTRVVVDLTEEAEFTARAITGPHRIVVLIVGGNIQGHTRVMTTAIVLETSQGHFALALALGAALLGFALLVNVLIVRLEGRPLP